MSERKDTKLERNNDPKELVELEQTLTRLTAHKGVQGLVVLAQDSGNVIRTTLDNIQTQQYASLVTGLASRGKSVIRDLDPEDDLTFLRIRSKKNEVSTPLLWR
ncbi:hypothetical protein CAUPRSCDRAFT_12052 [Caulochytrium protostelioides]|uniref:Roadblock/LAMTOR2 domain-containing protein n=1 Tax=Caulochytrium protostelioides TaxID=1555241 RepID=A0A4P9WSV5_9FUNG|nr:hypothetical protein CAUPRSCDRAFT_12052 [Caulochytrium protostelioides]